MINGHKNCSRKIANGKNLSIDGTIILSVPLINTASWGELIRFPQDSAQVRAFVNTTLTTPHYKMDGQFLAHSPLTANQSQSKLFSSATAPPGNAVSQHYRQRELVASIELALKRNLHEVSVITGMVVQSLCWR